MSVLRKLNLYPFLFGVYPILALLSHNIDQIKPIVTFRTIAIVLIGILIFINLFNLISRDQNYAAAVCSLLVILFFTYGHTYNVLEQLDLRVKILARHRYLLPVWLGFLIFGLWSIRRLKNQLHLFVPILNLIAGVALVIPITQILHFQIKTRHSFSQHQESTSTPDTSPASIDVDPPDIYYIILDAYTRKDILQENYNFDNSAFLTSLAEVGFYVADCSQSNYAQTELSMAATFNMDYLDNLELGFSQGSADRSDLWPLLRHGKVREILEGYGYKVIAFETGYYWIQWEDADIYLSLPKASTIASIFRVGGFSSFESLLVKTTLLRIFLDTTMIMDILDLFLPDTEYHEKVVRERTLFVLDQLHPDKVPDIPGPKFIYAHIVAPHPPYVFGPDGRFAEHGEEFTYTDQVTYINDRILTIVKEIIDSSETKPIIILQGDHGLEFNQAERLGILNAYYLPQEGNQHLYPSITPVNTFRFIFNQYFNTDFELLENISYFSEYDLPYDYEPIPNRCSPEALNYD